MQTEPVGCVWRFVIISRRSTNKRMMLSAYWLKNTSNESNLNQTLYLSFFYVFASPWLH